MKKDIMLELNSRMKEESIKYFQMLKKFIESNDDYEIYLLKNKWTKIEVFANNQMEDVKNVLIFIDDFKMSANLSLKNFKLEIYPFWIEKNKLNKTKYHYLFNYGNNEDDRFKSYENNEKLYKKMIKEFKLPEYTPINSFKGWKDFIKPYQFYVDLKKKFLLEDFEVLDGFSREISRVYLLNNEDEEYANIDEKGMFIEKVENNREQKMFIEETLAKTLLNEESLNKRKYYLRYLRRTYSQNDKKIAEDITRRWAKRMQKSKSKLSFFLTNEEYKKEELNILSDNAISSYDEKIMVNTLEFKEIYKDVNMLEFGKNKVISNINKITNINLKTSDIDELIRNFNEINNGVKKIYANFKKCKSELSKKLESIHKDDLETAKEIMSYETQLMVDNSNASILRDELLDIHEKHISDLNEINISLKDEIMKINSDKKTFNKSQYKDLSKDDIDKIKKDILEHNKECDSLVIKKEQQHKNLIRDKENKFKEETKTLIKNIYEENELIQSELNDLKDFLFNGTVRFVQYIMEAFIVFLNEEDKSTPSQKQNLYTLNTGDFALVNTIAKINKKIKTQEEYNNEILFKIIEQKPMEKLDLKRVEKDIAEGKYNEFISELNASQKYAFMNAIDTTDPIAIIQGPPGTGKTKLITELIKYFRTQNKKVILSSQTNVAIENVLKKMNDENDINNSIISPWLKKPGEKEELFTIKEIEKTWYRKFNNNILEGSDNKLVKELNDKISEGTLEKESNLFKNILLSKDVYCFGATTTTSVTLDGRDYSNYIKESDVLIIDEVSKTILPEILRYALDVKKVILVGDYKQLNPIFDIEKNMNIIGGDNEDEFNDLRKIIEKGIFYSLSKQAKKFSRLSTLNTNYRSVPGVLDAYNIFYEDEGWLKGSRKFEEYEINYNFKGKTTFDNKHSLYFFNILNSKEEKQGNSRMNKIEVNFMIKKLKELSETLENAKDKTISIIFPYSAQIRLFDNLMRRPENKNIRNKFSDLNWDTIDSFQGSESNIVFLSTVITDKSNRNFLSEFRRVNVSMSRAQDMLVIFGNKDVLNSLEIGGEGIETKKYFQDILDTSKNKYLKIENSRFEYD